MKKVFWLRVCCCFGKAGEEGKEKKELGRDLECTQFKGAKALKVFDMIHDKNGNVLQSPTLGNI